MYVDIRATQIGASRTRFIARAVTSLDYTVRTVAEESPCAADSVNARRPTQRRSMPASNRFRTRTHGCVATSCFRQSTSAFGGPESTPIHRSHWRCCTAPSWYHLRTGPLTARRWHVMAHFCRQPSFAVLCEIRLQRDGANAGFRGEQAVETESGPVGLMIYRPIHEIFSPRG
jgi:hypothetical protein